MTPLSPSALARLKMVAIFAVGALVGAFAAVQVAPDVKRTNTVVGQGPNASAPGVDGAAGPNGPGASVSPGASLGPGAQGPLSGSKYQCAAGRNGGATDTGVTATTIKLATTVARTGIGAAFLGEVQYAMEAIRNKVNREGGICGRLIEIRYVDDAWQPSGAQYLRNFIEGGVFAIPVGPSSEGLNVVIKNGEIRKAGIPVVGTDGMIISQYTDPWVWPVAVSTASSARIMARDAYKRGARKFSIVFDRDYRFGVEAAEAYQNEVKRLLKNTKGVEGYNRDHICGESFCGVSAGQTSYATEVDRFVPGDYVAMFLEPATALTWMGTPGAPLASGQQRVKYGIGAGQPLFTRKFAVNCQTNCDQIWVWTGFKPNIENYANDPGVRTFVSDLARTKPDADEFNQFSEGGYLGMQLLVEAMKQVGPNLTRARLRSVLDAMTFNNGLALQGPLRWRPCPNRGTCGHFAAATMQAFAIQFRGTFSGWRTKTIAVDPNPAIETEY